MDHNTLRKSSTRYFSPNACQIGSAVKGDDRVVRRRRLYPVRFILGAILIACLVYLATYFVLSRVLG